MTNKEIQSGDMPRYFYQDGTEVKENDIVFYSEDEGDHTFHYADNIGLIVRCGDELKMKAYVITMDEAKSFQYYEEPDDNMVSLKYYCENHYLWNKTLPITLQHHTKIGDYPKDKGMLSVEFAMRYSKKFSLSDVMDLIPTDKEVEKYVNGYFGYPEDYEGSVIISASEQAFVSGCDWLRSEIERRLKGDLL